MCDTMGCFMDSGSAVFAKNSDRSPNEPQITEWHPAKTHHEKTLRTTYIEIEQVEKTCAFLLSRPGWLWGGEMGVNEFGVCIGNEAVFTKGPYAKTGLTGMDLLRLALERADSAQKALEVILELLARYGQGGNCGYDHDFYYDNSFLIMDRKTLLILETAGKEWVWRQAQKGSISNRLSIGYEGDAYSGGSKVDFKAKHLEPIYSHFSGSKKRLDQTTGCVEGRPDLAGVFRGLRAHQGKVQHPLTRHSVSSTCMHAGGLVGDHTTASMVVEMGKEITVWLTGSSTPCISLFKPFRLSNLEKTPAPPVYRVGDERAEAYWQNREQFHRAVIGHVLPPEFYSERDALEAGWIAQSAAADNEDMRALTEQAIAEETIFYQNWRENISPEIMGKKRFIQYWQKKTAALASPARPRRLD